jgi:pantoate--beta-alanine ligase
VTIFVNPTQFGEAADLDAYPRDLESDGRRCRELGVDFVFAPSVREMYPSWPDPGTKVAAGPEANWWEGTSRPGHFDGVATVVTKLFNAAGPSRAYFGEKDFQQLAIVKRLTRELCLPVEVIGCPTVRENDGLAMSSRNVRLSPSERIAARALWRALKAGANTVEDGVSDPATVAAAMATAASDPAVELDYAVLVDAADLRVPAVLQPGGVYRLIVAAKVGPVRLIDNAPVELGAKRVGAAVNGELVHATSGR